MLSLIFYLSFIQVKDNRFWMYWVSPRGLHMMNYCNEVEDFIKYALFNPKNINGWGNRCSFKMCKNKKVSRHRCYDALSTKKGSHEKNTCVDLHIKNQMLLTRSCYKRWLCQLLVLVTGTRLFFPKLTISLFSSSNANKFITKTLLPLEMTSRVDWLFEVKTKPKGHI